MAAESTWVRVESEDELRVGMAVQSRPCGWCQRTETFFLTTEESPSGKLVCDPHGGYMEPSSRAFTHAGSCRATKRILHLGNAILEGRLYRLALSEPSQDVASADMERERVR